MKLSEHKDLKAEILALLPKEKDKLLLRLIAKDKVLTEHLHFLLLEDESDLEERTEVIKEQILTLAAHFETLKYRNAKDVLTHLRQNTKTINYFYKVTKANFEELSLKIFLLNNTPITFNVQVRTTTKDYEFLFGNYFIKSTLAVLKKFDKLHEDLQFDLKADLNKLLTKIYQGNMAVIAQHLDLPQQIGR
ncbi:MAG: hypothetical protein V4541_02480 [Bacteroidota bacterium]